MGEDEAEEREKKNRGREEVLVGKKKKKKGCLQEASMRCSESDDNHSTTMPVFSYIFSCIYYVHAISSLCSYFVIAAIQQAV